MPAAPTREQRSAHTRAIPRFAGYVIDETGAVFSTQSNWRGYGMRQMRTQPNSDGYPSVRLTVAGGKRKRLAVYRLVAAAFLSPRPSPAHEIRHLDGDKANSAATNLCWGTEKDNADDRERHGRTSRGERHSQSIKAAFARKAA